MTNKLKNKRGFSLVELMVVVAIMGTLASIAIPAFNEYRRSAKKNAYRFDLTSLHKSWLAFGVELDSFCDRDTNPRNASIQNVGMSSLLASKFYGESYACSDPGITAQGGCTGSWDHDGDTTSPQVNRIWSVGPGKTNFIGFGTNNCTTGSTLPNVVISDAGRAPSSGITNEQRCDLNVGTYEMGVVGHVYADKYFGQSMNQNGVLSSENEDTATDVDPQCAV